MKKYDIFLFDADDTLYDFTLSSANALRVMFEYCGFEYSDKVQATYWEINAQAWASYEKGEISVEELQRVRFARLFNNVGVSHDIEDFNARYLYELGCGAFLLEGTRSICREIVANNKQVYIVTNGLIATQEARAKQSPIAKYISEVFASEAIGYQKPDKEFFNYVCAHITDACKSQMLIIGDSLRADVVGGNNAGIDTCWFNAHGADNPMSIKPTYEIQKLSQLRQFI